MMKGIDLEEQVATKELEIEVTEQALAEAIQIEEDQYAAMKKRIQFMYGGKLQKVKFTYSGSDIDAILDRLPTAKVLSEENGVYTILAETFGKGIDMWLRSQGELVEIIS